MKKTHFFIAVIFTAILGICCTACSNNKNGNINSVTTHTKGSNNNNSFESNSTNANTQNNQTNSSSSSNNSTNEYVPIIKVDDNKSEISDGDKKIASSNKGINYVGSDQVGYTCLDNSWREVKIPNYSALSLAGKAESYKAYEDTENKYLLIIAYYGKATGNQEELTQWVKSKSSVGSTSCYYPTGSINELRDSGYGYIGQNSIFKGKKPIGYEFFSTIPRDDNKDTKMGNITIEGYDNILRGTIFEYNGNRYGLMYMRYNSVWDVDFQSVCNYWIPKMATENDITNQIKNSPAMKNN